MAHTLSKLHELADEYKSPNIHWRTFPNPMRSESLFVAEDLPIEPYESVSLDGPLYPATPQKGHSIPFALPKLVAHALVAMLNS